MQTPRDLFAASGGSLAQLDLLATAGRVAPFSDGDERCFAAIHPARPTVGAIFDWTGAPGVLAQAEAWLKEQGCERVLGPLELCTWFGQGAVVGPTEDAPFALETTQSAALWERAGYTPVSASAAAVVEHDPMIHAAGDRVVTLSTRGFSVRPLPLDIGEGRASEEVFREAVGMLHRIASEAVTETYGFVPVPLATVEAWWAPLRKVMDPRLVLIARSPDGEAAGLLFAVPDFCEPQRGWFVVKTLAVLPKYRHSGLGAWLVAAAHQAARKAGYKAGVHTIADRPGRDVSRYHGRVIRRYALLEKKFVP